MSLGDCYWINSILQQSNSRYLEGMAVPQRVILDNVAPAVDNKNVLTFNHEFTKGGVHAYDFLTSYDQAVDTAKDIAGIDLTLNPCGDSIGNTPDFQSICQALRSGGNEFEVAAPATRSSAAVSGTTRRVQRQGPGPNRRVRKPVRRSQDRRVRQCPHHRRET